MTIPTYREASNRRWNGEATAMDHFITEWQPTPPEADYFRTDLQAAVDHLQTDVQNLLMLNRFLRRVVLALMAAFLIQLVSAGIFLWMIT